MAGASVTVSRRDTRDIKFREAIILLDGSEIANLSFDQSVTVEVEPGSHTISATNRVFKSKVLTFDAKAGQRVFFTTGNIANGCFGFLMMFQVAPPSIFIRRVNETLSSIESV